MGVSSLLVQTATVAAHPSTSLSVEVGSFHEAIRCRQLVDVSGCLAPLSLSLSPSPSLSFCLPLSPSLPLLPWRQSSRACWGTFVPARRLGGSLFTGRGGRI